MIWNKKGCYSMGSGDLFFENNSSNKKYRRQELAKMNEYGWDEEETKYEKKAFQKDKCAYYEYSEDEYE